MMIIRVHPNNVSPPVGLFAQDHPEYQSHWFDNYFPEIGQIDSIRVTNILIR
jgi:hypothetical protein